MTNTVKIHGKDYVTVAGRVNEAHKKINGEIVSITTEILPGNDVIAVKATVVVNRLNELSDEPAFISRTFTGISSANPAKLIEKENPYEVAETSAVGRALGFAGYGSTDSIASADEMKKSEYIKTNSWPDEKTKSITATETFGICSQCGDPNVPPSVVKYSLDNLKKVVCYKCQHPEVKKPIEPVSKEPVNPDDIPF